MQPVLMTVQVASKSVFVLTVELLDSAVLECTLSAGKKTQLTAKNEILSAKIANIVMTNCQYCHDKLPILSAKIANIESTSPPPQSPLEETVWIMSVRYRLSLVIHY